VVSVSICIFVSTQTQNQIKHTVVFILKTLHTRTYRLHVCCGMLVCCVVCCLVCRMLSCMPYAVLYTLYTLYTLVYSVVSSCIQLYAAVCSVYWSKSERGGETFWYSSFSLYAVYTIVYTPVCCCIQNIKVYRTSIQISIQCRTVFATHATGRFLF
jgi:hypothetical protein